MKRLDKLLSLPTLHLHVIHNLQCALECVRVSGDAIIPGITTGDIFTVVLPADIFTVGYGVDPQRTGGAVVPGDAAGITTGVLAVPLVPTVTLLISLHDTVTAERHV